MRIFFILGFAALQIGCAHLPAWLGGPSVSEVAPPVKAVEGPAKYSDHPQMNTPTDRSYRRMTKNRMEEESDLGSQAGSMWVMDGQGAYLFAQNKTRKEGDILAVSLDSAAMKQVETKVNVIKKLLKQLEEQLLAEKMARVPATATASSESAGTSPSASAAPAAVTAAKPKPAVVEKGEVEDKQNLDDIKVVSSRITEKLPDGNYRIKGAQPFMIGKREYKLIVMGVLRPEDYNDNGIGSQKLLDPQYDVVSIRRKNNENN